MATMIRLPPKMQHNMLLDKLEQAGCEIKHASGDADLTIVQTAVAAAERNNTTYRGR